MSTVQISASDVNKLRQQTGAGMMDCKKALTETNGDFEAAVDYLRKKGAKVAELRAGRAAAAAGTRCGFAAGGRHPRPRLDVHRLRTVPGRCRIADGA